MKVIGNAGNNKYLVEISHAEIKKAVGKYYYGDPNHLKIGEEINIAAGYDFMTDIKRACEAMTTASSEFGKHQATMLEFAAIIAAQGEK